MKRRQFMGAGLAATLLPLGRGVLAARASDLEPGGPAPRLVVVFMRGAVDGLSVVVPYSEPNYYRSRSSIALARPGQEGGVLDLDGRFGLHPALAPLLPYWQQQKLAFVHASGSPDVTRSHFDAQDYMESGTPGRKSTPDGWMNRLLGDLPAEAGGRSAPTRAVSVGPTLPRILSGRMSVSNIANGAAAGRPTVLDRPQVGEAFAQLYDSDDRMSRAYQDSQVAHREVMASLDGSDSEKEMQAASNGAPLPNGFANDAARLATLMRNDVRVQFGFMAVGGWDTHANQGNAKGQLANRLAPLGSGLAALAQGLGESLDRTTIVVVSEFGRTVRQNGNGGTDHGHGNLMWLLGGPVRGGRIHGEWPGLEDRDLYEGRDLAVTSDFRCVLAQVAERHLRLADKQLASVFPQMPATPSKLSVMRV
jgi:uncharacterized protein (DUF1501 family)